MFTYCSDVGHGENSFDKNVLKLAQGADLFVHDSHFGTVEECRLYADWGHSNWYEAAQIAVEANVRHLALFHFSPDLTDTDIDNILPKARQIFPHTFVAREGMAVELPLTALPK